MCCFPLDRQRSQVQRCASALQRLHGELANVYWRKEMQALAAHLKGLGLPEGEVSRQAMAFTTAVQIELQRLFAAADEHSDEGVG
ncbi:MULTISPECIES: DUF6074 family protein [unclassified Rhizobium]|uniref:DUF6074 family protein n=1 Tax=unclassified Rhizobium TaxID=2613769 RepID=UPI0032AEDFEB